MTLTTITTAFTTRIKSIPRLGLRSANLDSSRIINAVWSGYFVGQYSFDGWFARIPHMEQRRIERLEREWAENISRGLEEDMIYVVRGRDVYGLRGGYEWRLTGRSTNSSGDK